MHQPVDAVPATAFLLKTSRTGRWLGGIALLCGLMGLAWFGLLWLTKPPVLAIHPTAVKQLQAGQAATMDSPIFTYSPGWRIAPSGADPAQPADAWHTPAGVVTFVYTGSELALLLAVGDYWGYLYVTVDGQPANLLPVLTGNRNSQGEVAGYRTFYAPEKQTAFGPTEQWVRVHRAQNALAAQQPHQVRIEVWRSWGQQPLRAVAVDALPVPAYPRWPGIALLLIAGWCVLFAIPSEILFARYHFSVRLLDSRALKRAAPFLALSGLILIAAGVILHQWSITLLGLVVLARAALLRPVFWLAALLFALPFYYTFPLPILPGHALSLIDVGILGGILLFAVHWLFVAKNGSHASAISPFAIRHSPLIIFSAITTWALVSAFNAEQFAIALHEWRVVFLSAALFGWLLSLTLQQAENPAEDQWWLVGAWLAGGTVVALVGLWQYASGAGLITAEGVWRVRAFYGSPNNLALYLERTLAVTLALALFMRTVRIRLLWGGLAVVQATALLLTFSKGALLLGLPALLLTLWCGGLVLLTQRGESRRPLWLLAGAAVLTLLALTPFLGTERFQRLLDLRQGTGFLRINLWQSAWQMALDHPWLGVGPDNFLYAFRSNYILPAAWQEPNLNHPHNWLLDWWTRLGLPGLALAVTFFGVTIRQLWRGLRTSAQPVLSLGLLAAVVAALAHGLIDASYALPDLLIVWVLLAICGRTES